MTRLGDIAEVFSGTHISKNSEEESKAKEIPLLRSRNLKDGHIAPETVETVNVKSPRQVASYRVQVNDVLIVTRGRIDHALVPETLAGSIISSDLTGIRVDQEVVLPSLVNAYLATNEGQGKLRSLSKGSNISYLSISDLKSVEIPIPPIEVQKHLKGLVLAVEKHEDILTKQINHWQSKLLLQSQLNAILPLQ